MNKRQSGFTLVEIAIVLVIIGLLLGGVFKGQEMIANSRYKSMQKDIQSYSAAFYTFQDRFRAVPGDFPAARATVELNALSPGGNNNGVIGAAGAGNQICNGNAIEACILWQQLRFAGLISGNPSAQGALANPTHAFGGLVQGMFTGTNGGRAGIWVQLQNVPADVAQRLDRETDDTTANTGTVFCSAGCAGANYPAVGAGGFVTIRVLI